MSRPRYQVRRMRTQDGSLAGWGVFLAPAGASPLLTVGFTGPFAQWRARFRAACLNSRGRGR